MKYLLFLYGWAACMSASGQADSIARTIHLKTKIIDTRGRELPGYLHSVNDSAILFSTSKIRTNDRDLHRGYLVELNYPDLETVTLWRHRHGARGAGFGMLVGMGLGYIIGYASYKDPGPAAWFDFGPGY